MKVLITGGSGTFGKNLLRHLIAAGSYDITSLDLSPLDAPLARQVGFIRCDIRDAEKVSAAMRNVDVVIHAAAAAPSYPPAEIHSIDVIGTKVLLQAAFDAGVERFVHISTTAVYGLSDQQPSRESDALKAYDPYNTAKINAEKLCQEFREKGLCIPILRPKSLVGPERLGLFAILYEWAYEGRNFPMVGKGDVPYQFLDIADFCRAAQLCMHADKAVVNDTFNIAAQRYATIREDYQAVLDAAGYGKRIICLPALPMIAALRVLELTRLSPLYRRLYLKLLIGSQVCTKKAERILGFVPTHSNQEALIRNYRWYAQNRDSFRRQAGISDAALWRQTGLTNNTLWRQGALRLGKAFF